MDIESHILNLKKNLNQHNINYYVHDNPTISDSEYDLLLQKLESLERKHPKYLTEDSPTQRVGGSPLTEFGSIQHSLPMLSLANAMNEIELEEFDSRIKKFLNNQNDVEYVAEPKLDGLAVELVYKKGKFIHGSTRGDGNVGEDITKNLKTIKGIPLSIQGTLIPDLLELRGEVFIDKDDFIKLNNNRSNKGLPLFANSRNCAAGSLRQLDPNITATRPLRIFCYAPGTIRGLDFISQMEFLSQLPKWGFPVNQLIQKGKGVSFLKKYYRLIEAKRKNLHYDIDGVVIKVNSYNLQNILGTRSKSPRWAIAGKFKGEQATTTIIDIIISVGRTGALTPVAKLNPIKIGGVIVSNATLHNQDEIDRKDIRIGDTVLVQRAGDVIPEIIKVISDKRSVDSNLFKIPNHCPECNSLAKREPDDATFRCTNYSCIAKIKGSIEHYVSKNCLNIDGLGIKIIDLFLNEKIIEDAGDLYNLNLEELSKLERLGKKSAQNIIDAINKSKITTLSRFINGLGIRNVGLNASKILEKYFNGNLEHLMESSQNELLEINEIGEIMANSIVDYFSNNDNKILIKKCIDSGLSFQKFQKVKDTIITNKTFVFTGTLNQMNRNDAKKIVESFGAKSSTSVSKNTDYVIAGEGGGSKIDKAKKLDVLILNELEFKDLINKL